MSFRKDDIERIIRSCLQKLRKQDKYLLDKKVNERTITHKLAEYLQEQFLEFNVDCEYNRFDEIPKKLELPTDKVNWNDTEAKTVFPDIIVHKRGTQKNNLLVIEIKKSSNSNPGNFDRKKLKAFIKDPYNYRFGLFLRIDLDDEDDCLEWFAKEN